MTAFDESSTPKKEKHTSNSMKFLGETSEIVSVLDESCKSSVLDESMQIMVGNFANSGSSIPSANQSIHINIRTAGDN